MCGPCRPVDDAPNVTGMASHISQRMTELEQYQDIWVHGKVQTPGIRECESRYQLIRQVAARYQRPFTVLDVGANLGYFSIRLIEDFPNCTVVACEGQYSGWLRNVLERNWADRVILLDHTFTRADLDQLAAVEHFDLVLAMSVMHHFDGTWNQILATFRSLGDRLIVETAHEPAACGRHITETTVIPGDAEMLGECPSHLDGTPRPIWTVATPRTTLRRSYIGTPLDDCNIEIRSDWHYKNAVKDGVVYLWHPGINLRTWLHYGGLWPNRRHIQLLIREHAPAKRHGDIRTHNIILGGNTVAFIDALDPRRDMTDDIAGLQQVLSELDG
jgi:SAM-dependent methyltransferase